MTTINGDKLFRDYLENLSVEVLVSKNKEMKEERRRMTIIKCHIRSAVIVSVTLLYATGTQNLR